MPISTLTSNYLVPIRVICVIDYGLENVVAAVRMTKDMKKWPHTQHRVTQLAITRRTLILFRRLENSRRWVMGYDDVRVE